MVRLILPTAFLFLLPFLMLGQNTQQYSLYALNPAAFNPAATGLDEHVILSGGIRNQWSGLAGSPVSQHVNVQMGAEPLSGGLGLFFEQEQLGSTRGNRIGLSYAYNYFLNRNSSIRMGFTAYWQDFSIDGDLIRTPGGVYEGSVPNHQDALFSSGNMQGSNYNTDFGLMYVNNDFSAGLSILNISEGAKVLDGLNVVSGRAYYLFLSNSFEMGRRMELTPSILLKSVLSQSQLDAGVKVSFDDNIVFGASFRGYNSLSIDSVVPFIGYYFGERVSLYYAYDIGVSALKTVHGGSHELFIRYDLGKAVWKGKLPPIIYNQRYKS